MVDKFTKPPYGEKVVDKINEIIDNLGSGGITVDGELSTTSENPVQNKVITGALNDKQDVILDLSTIRSGASAGSTALQPNDLATVATSGSYNDLADKPTIPSAVTETTVSGWGFTKNAGTITGITMNGSSKGTSGVVDLGTVITSHQDISGKANTDLSNLGATSSTNFDGQMIFKYVELLNGAPSAINTSTNLKTTGYLPNDNYEYAVFVKVSLRTKTTQVKGRVGNNPTSSDAPPTDFAIDFRANDSSIFDYQNAWLPLNADGIIYYQTNAKPNTGIIIALNGYRRIGTNS